MKIYITYINYDDSEYYLWNVSTKKGTAIKMYLEEDVLVFLSGGQPDISRLILITTNASKPVYKQLIDASTSGADIEKLLREIENDAYTEQVKYCDGDLNYDLAQFYGLNYKSMTAIDFEDHVSDVFFELDELQEQDPIQYNSIVNRFAKQHFGY